MLELTLCGISITFRDFHEDRLGLPIIFPCQIITASTASVIFTASSGAF